MVLLNTLPSMGKCLYPESLYWETHWIWVRNTGVKVLALPFTALDFGRYTQPLTQALGFFSLQMGMNDGNSENTNSVFMESWGLNDREWGNILQEENHKVNITIPGPKSLYSDSTAGTNVSWVGHPWWTVVHFHAIKGCAGTKCQASSPLIPGPEKSEHLNLRHN